MTDRRTACTSREAPDRRVPPGLVPCSVSRRAIAAIDTEFPVAGLEPWREVTWTAVVPGIAGVIRESRTTQGPTTPPTVERIVSGGQTGADRAALDWAIEHGLEH